MSHAFVPVHVNLCICVPLILSEHKHMKGAGCALQHASRPCYLGYDFGGGSVIDHAL